MPPLPPRPAQPGPKPAATTGAPAPRVPGPADRVGSATVSAKGAPIAPTGAIPFAHLAEIATGATARVDLCRVLAPHRRAGNLVAVKRLHPHVAEDPTFTKEFLDEVWMTASLRHPNVVEVAGWGSDAQGQYLAVELVQGVSLLRLMKTIFETGEAFTERMVVYIASRICLGLAAAHSLRAQSGELLNLVHRDLTPSNVLTGFNGEVKIADFGMAKAKQRLTKTLTGMRKGEPTYMAPEQASSDEIDARADLFSLGVMLFELFAGRRPWVAKSDYDMVQITSREPPADLRELRPKIDKELVAIVNRCLERSPAMRWQNAQEIAARLEEWLTVHGYQEDNEEALGRFVRRNAMRQMRWFERAIAGELVPEKVGRELPRVPTYTEHTKPPTAPPPADALTMGTTPPNPGAPTPAHASPPNAVAPTPSPGAAAGRSRPPNDSVPTAGPVRVAPPRPVDPRTIRAANAVQQLKKLAPPVEPPRAQKRRRPAMDEEDGDPTEVQLDRSALPLGPGAMGTPGQKRPPDEDEDIGEEIPTLVQKDDATIRAIREEAARLAHAKPAYTSPGMIVDEASDQRITDVKRDEPRRAPVPTSSTGPKPAGKIPSLVIADPESDLPTAPVARGADADLSEAPTPLKPMKANSAALRAVIPPSPDVPPRPFPSPGLPTDVPAEKPARATVRPPPTASVAPPRPQPQPSEAPRQQAPEQARVTYDDVQVLDRDAVQQRVTSEESLIAEADRLSIEAARRSEEARSAQIRAERKAAAARVASEAAAIAADALQLLRASGLAVALKRIEEARALDRDLANGRNPSGEIGPSLRPGAPSTAPPSYPEAATTQPSASLPPGFEVPRQPQAPAPAPGPALASIPALPSAPPAILMAPPPPPPPPMAVPHGATRTQPMPPPTAEPPRPQALPVVPTPAHPAPPPPGALKLDDALPPNLQPTIFGLPSTVVISLAAIALVVALILVLLLSK